MRTATCYLRMLCRQLPTRYRTAWRLPVFMILLAGAAPLPAQGIMYKTGNDLLEALRQATGLEHAYALNYIVGVVDAVNGSATREGFCFDLKQQGIKASQIADVVQPFLEKNPQMRDRPGSVLVAAALAEVWPCK